jgi:hypothetical protein
MTNTADTPEMLTELRAIRALLERQLVLSMYLTFKREPPEFAEQLNQAWMDSQLAAPVLPGERQAAAAAATRCAQEPAASPHALTTAPATHPAAAGAAGGTA